jgi:hypothetical protein
MRIRRSWLAELRAERNTNRDGRVYTLHYTVTDPSGNAANGSCKVSVPRHSWNTAVDSGPSGYCVGPGCP